MRFLNPVKAPNAANGNELTTLSQVEALLSSLIGGAPGALDTLNELAAAINDDDSYAATITTALGGKLSLDGGTMTGPLELSADGSGPMEAVTKQQLDAVADAKLSLTGGTLSGALTLDNDPSSDMEAATKHYVDVTVANLIDSSPGALDTLNELAAALGDDENFAATMTTSLGGKLSLDGGTMTGDIVLAGAPSNDLHPATKAYADARLSKSGGTMTGAIVLAADASNAMHPVTKQQLDSAISGVAAAPNFDDTTTVAGAATNGSTTTFTINHAKNSSKFVLVLAKKIKDSDGNATSGETWDFINFATVDANNITVTFPVAPHANEEYAIRGIGVN